MIHPFRLLVAFWCFLVVAFGLTSHAANFPLEAFKRFINEPPTIELLEFQARSDKYRGHGDSNAFQLFSAKVNGSERYSLAESGEVQRIPDYFYGRFESTLWHRLNRNDVVVTELSLFDLPEENSVFRVNQARVGILNDLLDMGLMDLFGSNVTWSGNTVRGTNRIGAQMVGQLKVSDNLTPIQIALTLTLEGKSYPYLVQYEFDTDNQHLPLPSRMKISSMGGAEPTVVSEYIITAAKFSERTFTEKDVSYAPFKTASSRTYAMTNQAGFLVYPKKNELVRVWHPNETRRTKPIKPMRLDSVLRAQGNYWFDVGVPTALPVQSLE